jgi:hypothetical protein
MPLGIQTAAQIIHQDVQWLGVQVLQVKARAGWTRSGSVYITGAFEPSMIRPVGILDFGKTQVESLLAYLLVHSLQYIT